MKRFLYITLNVLIWMALIAYFVFAARHCRGEQHDEMIKRAQIVVADYGDLKIVSPETVREWLAEAGIAIENVAAEQVNTDSIMSVIGRQPFVKSIQAYTEQSGTLHITLTQRRPIARIARGDGTDMYVADDMWVLPTKTGVSQYVPVITGNFGLPFADGWFGELCEPPQNQEKKLHQNYIFLLKLINFVKLLDDDPFWNAQVVQINVRGNDNAPQWKEPDIELIPRMGNHLIALGTVDRVREKLDKLTLFYRNVLDYEGWDTYRLIDIRYRNQIVCRK